MKNHSLAKSICVALSTAVAVGLVASAEAQTPTTLFTTNFNAPTYADGPLNTNTDTTTAGQDGWLNSSGAGTANISVSNTATNGILSLVTAGQDVRHLFTPVTSGSVYFRVDINVSAAQAGGDYFMHFSDGGTSSFFGRTYIRSSGAGFQLALGTGAGTATYGATVLNLNTPYTLLVRYDFVAGTTNDTGALYVNPTTATGSGDTAYVSATTIGADATTIGAIALRQGAAGNSATLTVDNITVTSTAVPEPATYAYVVAGLGALALGIRRRRVA